MDESRWLKIALVSALVCLCASQMDQEVDMEDEAHAQKEAGMPHLYNCMDEGVWAGSCDMQTNGRIKHTADWSAPCDPWKAWKQGDDIALADSFENWTCPEEYRSMSGCGDMLLDPRGEVCEKRVSFDFDLLERVVGEVAEPLVPMKHACVQHPLFYDNMNTAGKIMPPMVGRHRPRWLKWGEYEFAPAQRWLHNAEHGGIVFLYDICMDEESLCLIRNVILKWQETFKGDFRFILSPWKNLPRPFAMVSWSELYMTRGFNEFDIDQFIESRYRHAWEDYGPTGHYDLLWVDMTTKKHVCDAATMQKAEAAKVMPLEKIRVTKNTEELVKVREDQETLHAEQERLHEDQAQLRSDQQSLHSMATAAITLSGISVVAGAIASFVTLRRRGADDSGEDADLFKSVELSNPAV